MHHSTKLLLLGATLLTLAISGMSETAVDYYNRGKGKVFKGDLDGAIADLTKAIQLKPDMVEAYLSRGGSKVFKNDLDGAIADYTKAIELKPDSSEAHTGRAFARKSKGDFAGAMADYTKVIQLDPQDADAHKNRGYIRYDLQNFADALSDFNKAIKLDNFSDDNKYVCFRVWLIRSRLGEAEAASAELKQYLDSRTTAKPNDWAAKIGRFLTGQLAETELLTSAAKHPDPSMKAIHLCEAYFYAGSKRLLASDKAAAADYFQKAIATNQKKFRDYTSAEAELKVLKAQKN